MPNSLKAAICSQTREISAFVHSLRDNCRRRSKGVDSRGASKGRDNDKLTSMMESIRTVSDLCAIQSSPTSSVVGSVLVAASRLHSSGIIPHTVPVDAVRATYEALKELPPSTCKGLFKELYRHNRSSEMRPYMELVVRAWLVSPTETVVESMAITVKAVFGENRVLDHENAAHELIIRWNGPDLVHADWLIERVLRKNPHFNHFVRTNIAGAVEGTVISRHRRHRNPRSYIYKDYH